MPSLTQEEVPYQSGVAFFPVRRGTGLFQQGAGACCQSVHPFGLQFAVGTGHNAVTAAGVKAGLQMAVFVHAHRQLNFVAVTVGVVSPSTGRTGTSNLPRRAKAS